MALTLTQLSAALSVVLFTQLTSQINRAAVTLSILNKKPGRGPNCAWDVEGGTNAAATYSDGQDVDTSGNATQQRAQAKTDWAIYGDHVVVGDLAAAVAQSMTPGAAPDELVGALQLFMHEVETKIPDIAERLNKHLLSGTGTYNSKPAVVGLDVIAKAGNSDSYASLIPSSYDFWRGLTFTADDPRKITVALLQTFFQAFMKKDGSVPGPGRKPTHCAMHPDLYLVVKQELEEKLSINIPGSFEIPGPGGTKLTLPGGSSAFNLDGVWCYQEPDAPTDAVFAWVNDYVDIVSLSDALNHQPGVLMETVVKELMGNVEIDYGTYGVPGKGQGNLYPYVKFLAKTGLGTRAFVGLNVALRVRRRNAVGALRNLSATEPAP